MVKISEIELKKLLEETRSALLSASGAYKLMIDIGMKDDLPGLGHTSENNTNVLEKLEHYIEIINT